MHDAVHIDPATGDIRLADIRITPQTKADDLPARFTVGPVRSVSVEGKDVPCQFATVAALDRRPFCGHVVMAGK